MRFGPWVMREFNYSKEFVSNRKSQIMQSVGWKRSPQNFRVNFLLLKILKKILKILIEKAV